MESNIPINPDELGERHSKFRVKVLKLKQSELAELRNLSQSTISNFDRGQMPNKEYLDYMADNGCNLHWYLTGIGSMLMNTNPTLDNSDLDYSSFKKKMDFELSNLPIAILIRKIEEVGKLFVRISNDGRLNEAEKEDLNKDLYKKIREIYNEFISKV